MSSEGLDPSVPRAEDAFEDAFKVITIGDPDVGKTCLILRYTTDTYRPNLINTVGQRLRQTRWVVGRGVCAVRWGGQGDYVSAGMRGGAAKDGGRGISNTVGPFYI